MSTVEQQFGAVDLREQEVITQARFFESYKEDLKGLVGALYPNAAEGDGLQWSDDPRDMLPYIRERWIGREHSNSPDKDQFTEEQFAAAAPILARMGLFGETLPEPNMAVNDAIVLGGTTQANYRREAVVHKAVDKLGVTTDLITFWLGQRPREKRDGTKNELLSTLGRFAGNHIAENPWVQRELRKPWGAPEGEEAWDSMFGTETAVGRVAMLKQLPDGETLVPHRIDLQVTDVTGLEDPTKAVPSVMDGVPARLITDYRFTTKDGQDITIMNAAANLRPKGPPRHTTVSCAVEWLGRHTPPQNARVLFVTSNPHTVRTAQDVHKVLDERGRGDIQFVVAGASAPDNAPIQLFLGEVGRLIDNDVKRNYQS